MYSSVKFLSPIVTGGLPTPGPLPAAGVELAPVDAVLLEDFLELPQAASVTVLASRRTMTFNLLMLAPPLLSLRGLGHDGRDRDPEVVAGGELHSARRQHALNTGERELDHEGEQRDADRGAQHS